MLHFGSLFFFLKVFFFYYDFYFFGHKQALNKSNFFSIAQENKKLRKTFLMTSSILTLPRSSEPRGSSEQILYPFRVESVSQI